MCEKISSKNCSVTVNVTEVPLAQPISMKFGRFVYRLSRWLFERLNSVLRMVEHRPFRKEAGIALISRVTILYIGLYIVL